jgi:hypothetical protein
LALAEDVLDDDDDDIDFVPEICEEEEVEEEEEEGEATLDAWADVLADKFIVPMVDGEAEGVAGVAEESDDVAVVAGAPVQLMRPRAKKPQSQDVPRIGSVCERFVFLRPPGLLARLAQRFDVPKVTVRVWFLHWLSDSKWRPYERMGPCTRRLFYDNLERWIVEAIKKEF